MQDVFFGKEDLKMPIRNQSPFSTQLKSLEKVIEEKAVTDYGLFPNKNWIEKCIQIYTISKFNRGIILCGAPCSGKTSTLTVLVDSLSEIGKLSVHINNEDQLTKQQSLTAATHKLRRYFGSSI